MHISVPANNKMEIIEQTEISPLISHAKVKVCYVGQQPNRNKTVITKELATEMGKKLPGSPVVGRFYEQKEDYGAHDREVKIAGNKFDILDVTKPYGFVPTNAQVWFQEFNDEGTVHEYLCTECYIWTEAYPESKRIITKGNNQSMELTQDVGFWTKDNNSGDKIFIYNEALIEKLCILGEDIEPCFEGAQIKANFSLEDFEEFKNNMYSMLNQLLNKGGSQMEEEKKVPDPEFEKKNPEKDKEKEEKPVPPNAEEKPSDGKPEEEKEDEKKKKPDENHACGDDDKKKKYDLADVIEYQELNNKYNELQNQFSALQAEKDALDAEVATLRQYKLDNDRQNKQAMIDSFYMLEDEDKKDVVEHIDTYSLDEIEGKLAVICVRKKVNFNLGQEEEKEDEVSNLFNLNAASDNAPDWIKAARVVRDGK